MYLFVSVHLMGVILGLSRMFLLTFPLLRLVSTWVFPANGGVKNSQEADIR